MLRFVIIVLAAFGVSAVACAIGIDNDDIILRGDADGNGRIDLADPIAGVNFLFQGGALACPKAGDVNADGKIDLADVVSLLNYLYLGGPMGQPVTTRCM